MNGINGSSSSSAGIAGYYEYYIRPLGCFSQKEPVVKDVKDLLPFAVGMELMGGPRDGTLSVPRANRASRIGTRPEREGRGCQPARSGRTMGQGWGEKVSFGKVTPDWDQVLLSARHGAQVAL